MNATLSRGEYVVRMAKAGAERLTGVFEVSSQGRWRRIHLRCGEAVWAETSERKDLTGEDLVVEAIASPLAWEPSHLVFEERRTLSIDATHAAVSDPVLVRRALWEGVKQHIDLNDVLPSVIDPAAGPMRPTMGLWSALEELAVGAPYEELPNALGSGATVDEMFTRIPDRSGILLKLLWMLERAELIERPSAAKPRLKPDPRGRIPQEPPAAQEGPADRLPPEDPPTSAIETPIVTDTMSMHEEVEAADRRDFSWWAAGKSGDGETPQKLQMKPAAATNPANSRPVARRNTAASSGPPVGKASPREIEQVIGNNHRKRMGRDYYTFLGLPKKAPTRHVERSCRQLLRRWNIFSRRADVKPQATQQIEELLASLQLVYRTLGQPDRKEEYDRRVDRGTPPIVGAIRAASKSTLESAAAAAQTRSGASSSDILAAMRAMEAKTWDRALSILHQLRMQNPSDPDVLAELGWCAHMQGSSSSDASEEYLLLAVTFDSEHPKANEYLARMAIERKEFETARRRLTKLTHLDPQNRWARRALRKLPPQKSE
jgi:hypothetical protein